MENFGMIFDIKSYRFTDENSGFIINGEDVMMLKSSLLIDIIENGTGVRVDDFFIDVLRDTIEVSEPTFPW